MKSEIKILTLPQFKMQMLLIFLSIIFTSISCQQTKGIVRDVAQFNNAVQMAKPGDRIVLANGVWKDVELVFTGEGTETQPIILTVEEKGKVTLEGNSNIRIAGTYLHVEGLVFKNGFTPTNEVISFRRNKDHLANYCRVTECVIDNYNNPERFESDYWVGIYGKHNRFDHNYLTGKRNQGVTLAIRLTTEESRENFHRVDHNYFGQHPILGSNGGETLRIGTSHYSMSNSNSIVEFNYFDRCNGEHEIISNKSGQNIYRNNTFFECQGTLTMRHGNETLVENNFFFGNGKPNTGGIRIINEKQKVINNYCEGLTGYRFRGALVIMNGVPNSPLNRYFQVKESEASNNTFIDCDYIQLCAGSDEERSATPESTTVRNNIFYNEKKDDLFTVYDDISGISFSNNLLSPNVREPIYNTAKLADGSFEQKTVQFETVNGVKMPTGAFKSIGFQGKMERATPENTGVSWYPRVDEEIRFGSGKKITVAPGENTLLEAVRSSKKGDIIQLAAGEYIMTKAIDIYHPLIIENSNPSGVRPTLKFQRSTLFNIENGGSLSLNGLNISGEESEDKPDNAVIRTSRYSMINNYKLEIINCDFVDLDKNHSFNVVKVFKNTFAESILLQNSTFRNITGEVLALDKEIDDIGIYNVENVDVVNCIFEDIGKVAIKLHRGGGDESTFGPILNIDHSVFTNVGKDQRNSDKSSVDLFGVQLATIKNTIFNQSLPLKMHLSVGEPVIRIEHSDFYNSGEIISNSQEFFKNNIFSENPKWVPESNYTLDQKSPLKSKGTDGKDVGVIRIESKSN